MAKLDLHIHTDVSDGRYTPAEIVRKAAGIGMKVIAITDHDNIDGIAPALEEAKKYPDLTVVPGVEISTDTDQGEVHMLGYFMDFTFPELVTALDTMRHSREQRAQDMLAKLAEMGLPLEWERVQEIAGEGTVGRPHIARAMMEKDYITTFKEAFTDYIGGGKPAYVKRIKATPAEAVGLVLRAGGVPVVAHPLTSTDPESLIAGLKDKGLAGLEAYYGEYAEKEISRLVRLADKYGLITTAGSDYHGLDETTETMIGALKIPREAEDHLMSLLEGRLGASEKPY